MSDRDESATLATPVSEQRDHIRGPRTAAVTLVEYGDYECPYCGEAHPIVQQVIEQFGDRLRFVFRNFPINTIHEHAGVAAQAAEAAAASAASAACSAWGWICVSGKFRNTNLS